MKIRTKYILRLFLYVAIVSQLPFLLSSCAEDSFNWLVGTPINVTAVQSADNTRAADNILSGNFEGGETLNAYYKITGGAAIGSTPTTLTAAAPANGKNALTPDVQPYYPSTGTVDIYALYPPTKANAATTTFSVEADQTGKTNYMLSDLMWASAYAQAKKTDDVNLEFSHQMAKMVITVTGAEGVTIKSVKMINTVREIGISNISLATRTLGALASPAEASAKQITVATSSNTNGEEQLSGAVLFPPQTIAADFIEVVTNYGTTLFSTNKAFVGGKQYTANLTITRQMIGFTATITDWAADDGTIAVPPGSSAGLLIADIPDQDYTGSAIEPTLTITYSLNSQNYNLVKDTDYTLTFFNNVNTGVATIIIEGKADPSKGDDGTTISKLRALKSFNITTATGNISYPNNNAKVTVEYQYNATVDNALEKNGGDGTFTYSSDDEGVAKVSESGTVTILKAGTTTIRAHMANDGNYSAADAQYVLEVTPRNIKTAYNKTPKEINISLSYTTVKYNGQAYEPQVVVTDNGRTLQKDTHYTVAYSNNVNKGSASVTISGKGNYSSAAAAAVTLNFSITSVDPVITMTTDAITLPVGFTATRLASTTFGTVTYSSDATGTATFTDGVIRAIAVGTTTVKATVAAEGTYGNWTTQTKSISVTVVQSYWAYAYTGAVQTWECPLTGVYRLEAFGAQGATYGGFNGGRGAHIAGQLKVTQGDKLYIYVGGQGEVVTATDATKAGGWNGGGHFNGTYTGYTGSDSRDQHRFCGGGGATDFALVNATWNTTNHMNNRILVAGGGGGALFRQYDANNWKFTGAGGSGGAYVGETGIGGSKPGGGGTLSAGGAAGSSDATAGTFGYGGNYNGTTNSNAVSAFLSAGCGGGGWYGGGAGGTDTANENPSSSNFSRQGAGGGGSSYIYNATNATYYPSGVTKPDTKYYITPTTLTEGARTGNGEARITYMGEEE